MGPIIITLSTTSSQPNIPLSSAFASPPFFPCGPIHNNQNFHYAKKLAVSSSTVLSLKTHNPLCLLSLDFMEGTLGLLGGGGGGGGGGFSGGSSNESTLSKVEVMVMEPSEATSYPAEAELELGLSLGGGGGCGGAGKPKPCRILTAKDFPSMVFSQRPNASSAVAVSGTKRAADSVPQEGGSPTGASQVVGWPPISAARMNSLVNQAKNARAEDDKAIGDKSKETSKKKINIGNKAAAKEQGLLGFVKVNMDGTPIGRKVDVNAHACYESLAQTLEDMFFSTSGADKEPAIKPSKLLDGSSEFVLTYEDKEGDWMLVGDVPWGMFLSSVKRLRIMRTSEANGLAPRFQERSERQSKRPI